MNIGIMGCGNIAKTMAAIAHKTPGVHPYAAASRSLEKAQRFAAENDVDTAYGSYEEMLQDPKVDIVYIATPHSRHAADVMLCADYGKPMLCEKPFALNARQAKEALDYAEKKGVAVTEGIWPRYMPHAEILSDLAESGKIGKIVTIRAAQNQMVAHNARLLDPALGGGALLDVGIYPLTFTSMVLGEEISSVCARAQKTELGIDLQDSIILSYKNGAVADVHASIINSADNRAIVCGTEGYAVIGSNVTFKYMDVFDPKNNLIEHVTAPNSMSGYAYELLACKKMIEEGRLECTEIPHAKIVKMMEILDSVRKETGVRYAVAGE